MSTEATASVLKALSSLYGTTNRQANREANRWLEAFQKKPEAWAVANSLMKLPEIENNVGARLFAAQTLKQKITYDLRDLRTEARVELRDSLLELLWQSSNGPKAVMIQLCLAVADLAIQLLQWKTVIPDLIDKFGKSDHGSVCLLEILKVLPEEMNGNTRLPLTDHEYKSRGEELIDSNAKRVLDLLTTYMQSSGNNTELQERVLKCLSSWIRTGEMDIELISTSPLLELSFKSLESPELFDVAVDVVSEIIYETRDVNDCRPVIEQIYPSFATLLQKLVVAIEEEDEDAVRGYGRIFVEAGEAYITLIGSHPEAFGVLVDGIMKVSAYSEVEIVSITFKFWYELTNLLETETFKASIPQFLPYYDALVDIMIGHLHYPTNFDSLTAEENDNFRDFRHDMGDTLKDCCRILTPQRCLVKPMNLLAILLNDPSATWQQIEAPIFSLRVMGSEVPRDENEVMPHIMEFLSKLPDHPKIRYAATLVISRYSFWTESHPQFIEYQLNFISNGMQNAEVAAASALALKHLCKDCNKHLVNYLVQLQSFYVQVTKSLPFRDILEVTEAVSHVISVTTPAEIQKALQDFCLPVAQDLHGIISRGKDNVTNDDCVKMGDILEQISVFFDVIRPDIPVGQLHPCIAFITELWPVLDATLANFGQVVTVSEPLCKCFNSFIVSYGPHFIPLLPQLIERIVNAFAITGLSGYLWVSLRLIRGYSSDGEGPCFDFVQRLSQAMFIKMQGQPINDIPDVIEEYFRLITAFLENAPVSLLQDPLLETIFQAGIAGLSITEQHALGAILAFYRKLLDLSDKSATIVTLYKQFGGNLTAVLLNGSIDFYNQDSIPDVAALFKRLAEILPQESSAWMMTVINAIPEEYISMEIKADFIANWTSAINEQHWIKVRRIFSDFVATYRRRNANKVRS
ncbi:armadillo-type protein [Parasitella parasitica]|nr:armadillo-type protein [Parasitella parasitica]